MVTVTGAAMAVDHSGTPAKHWGRHAALVLLVALVVGVLWRGLLPRRFTLPTLIGLAATVIGLLNRWHPHRRRHGVVIETVGSPWDQPSPPPDSSGGGPNNAEHQVDQ